MATTKATTFRYQLSVLKAMKKILLLWLLLTVYSTYGQVFPNLGGQRAGISSLVFLKNDISPRSLGMSGFNVSMRGDAYAQGNNPAAMTDLEGISGALSNLHLIPGMRQSYAGVIIPNRRDGALGISINALTSDKQEVRTEFQPNGTGEYFYSANAAFAIGYAKRLSDRFSFGVSTKYIYEQLADYYDHAFGVDLGFLYKTDYKGLQFAVVLQNFGSNTSLRSRRDQLPVTFNRTDPSLEKVSGATVFKFGASITAFENSRHMLILGSQLNHPSDNTESIHTGVEYSYQQLFFARSGIRINVRGQQLPTFGIGLRLNAGNVPLQLDYAANPTDFLGIQHSIGLSVALRNLSKDVK
jgi:hypothetical protein